MVTGFNAAVSGLDLLTENRVEDPRVTDLAGFKQFDGFEIRVFEVEAISAHQEHVVCGRIRQSFFPAIVLCRRERFFTKNMDAGAGGANRVFAVQVIWKGYIDGIDFAASKTSVVIIIAK